MKQPTAAIIAVLVAVCFITSTLMGMSEAATIKVEQGASGPLVIVTGTLKTEDGDYFAKQVSTLDRATVLMDSPGGELYGGLLIGELIRIKHFRTFVPDGGWCTSACAFAWLAGSPRYMGATAQIGFHAAYKITEGKKEEVGAGNAVLGAYLHELGLSFGAIRELTSAAPDEVKWLTIHDAKTWGIDVAVLETKSPAIVPIPRPAAPENLPKGVKLDEIARQFIATYFAHWSETNEDALRYFSKVYADKIMFLDKPVAKPTLMEEKRNFADRWPARVYVVHPDSIAIQCHQKSSTCVITGKVEWDCRSPAREARSSGLANFTLQIAVSQNQAVRVDGEWSSVLSIRNE